MKILSSVKKRWKYVVTAVVALTIGASAGTSSEELNSVNAELKTLQEELATKNETIEGLETQNNDLEAKVEAAAPFFKLQEEERLQKEAEAKAAEEKRLAEEKAKKEAEAKAAEEKRLAEEKAKKEAEAKEKAEAEAKAKQGYETGITYEQLARTPDDYAYEKVKFSGKVVQVMEGDGETQLRIAVNSDYDTILFAAYNSSITSSRILEDDQITIYGLSSGLITYESAMGGQISIPGVLVEKIEQ